MDSVFAGGVGDDGMIVHVVVAVDVKLHVVAGQALP